jgi:hypothetical protein
VRGNGFGNEIPATDRTGAHWTDDHTFADLQKHNGLILAGSQVFLLQGVALRRPPAALQDPAAIADA